jgi:hypothetical protein
MVFGSGAIAGLLSSLLAYISRALIANTPSRLLVHDLLRVGAVVAAIGSGAAFLTGLNMVALAVPESSSTRPKSKPPGPGPAGPVKKVRERDPVWSQASSHPEAIQASEEAKKGGQDGARDHASNGPQQGKRVSGTWSGQRFLGELGACNHKCLLE